MALLAKDRLGGHHLLAHHQCQLRHEVFVPLPHVPDKPEGVKVRHPELFTHSAAQLVGQVLRHEALKVSLHVLGCPRLVETVHHRDLRLDAHLVLLEEAHGGRLHQGQLSILLEDRERLHHTPAADHQRNEDALRGDDHVQRPDAYARIFVDHIRRVELSNSEGVVRPPETQVVLLESLSEVCGPHHVLLQHRPSAAVEVRKECEAHEDLQQPDAILQWLECVKEGLCTAHLLNQANGPQELQKAQCLEHFRDLRQPSQT
mmetsp:Transcript_42348/g.98071  ORF Transcript_42348/g.98071 Transcript_42348/m.98071 type:complete len:260 (-) Transcript_42348:472-1251(-)